MRHCRDCCNCVTPSDTLFALSIYQDAERRMAQVCRPLVGITWEAAMEQLRLSIEDGVGCIGWCCMFEIWVDARDGEDADKCSDYSR